MPECDLADKGLSSLIKPLDSTTSTDELHNAIAVSQRLRDDGLTYFNITTNARDRWIRGCNELISLINIIPHQIQTTRSDTICTLNEFTSEFDHTKSRLLEISYCKDIPDNIRLQNRCPYDGLVESRLPILCSRDAS